MRDVILGSAVTPTERVPAARRSFITTEGQCDEFIRLLDEPIEASRLDALLAEESPLHDGEFRVSPGSSPLARGAHVLDRVALAQSGLIPARAGSTASRH